MLTVRIVLGRILSTSILRISMAFPLQPTKWAQQPEVLAWLASSMQNQIEAPSTLPPIPTGGIKLGHVYELIGIATDKKTTARCRVPRRRCDADVLAVPSWYCWYTNADSKTVKGVQGGPLSTCPQLLPNPGVF